jgi:UDP-N-acetylglucosamine 2-epimerase (non-hydrolysing)
MKKIKNLIVLGLAQRPLRWHHWLKLLKMKPVLLKLKFILRAQHRETIDQVLSFFKITPDYDLDLMKPNQNLYSLTADIITSQDTFLN